MHFLGSLPNKRESLIGSSNLPSLCRKLLKSSLMSRLNGYEETIADRVMVVMQTIKTSVAGIQDVYSTRNEAFISSGELLTNFKLTKSAHFRIETEALCVKSQH